MAPTKYDPEVIAINRIGKILDELEETRPRAPGRVLNYLYRRYADVTGPWPEAEVEQNGGRAPVVYPSVEIIPPPSEPLQCPHGVPIMEGTACFACEAEASEARP
jgi:hypothetical protein